LIRRYTLIAENTLKVMNNERPRYLVEELQSIFVD
jgi:Fe-S cluster biosynthesis and repair protein YggX